MDLGNIEKDIPKTQWKELSILLEMRLNGQTTYISYSEELEKYADMLYSTNVYSKSKSEITEQTENEKDFDTIDINSIQVSEARQVGPEIVAKSVWDELELESLFSSCEFSENEISVSMALMVDGSGFPVYSRVYEGNVSEPETLEEVIQDVKSNTPSIASTTPPVFVMDRGIATKENIEFLKHSKYGYIVVERANIAKEYQDEFSALKKLLDEKSDSLEEFGWETIRSASRIEEGKEEEVLGRIKVYVKEVIVKN